ncbi:MAG: peptide deformylase [Candidatus Latescibacteria bacterium]|jgi:peptide deformylase|nr:peptide deformylase [Candidatus Latescibacterota bacterium]
MKREIVMFGSQVLRKPCPPVTDIDDEIRALVGDLFDSMRAAEGVGLAAPQIGILKRVCIIDVSTQQPEYLPVVLINPKITAHEGEQVGEEGCLSFPDLYGDVERYSWVEVEATDINGETFKTAGEGFYARALQHEIDHLNGTLFIDHLSTLKKQLMRGALKRLKKEGEAWDRENG